MQLFMLVTHILFKFKFIVYIAVLYRVENNIIFEELKSMDKSTNSLATVFEKESKDFEMLIVKSNIDF